MTELRKTPGSPIGEIAQELVQKSLVIDGMKTEINGKAGVIKEVRGHAVIVELGKQAPYPAGAPVRLSIPKKNIAVTDFEVIRGKEKDLGRVTLEGLTTALIDSGQFNVVERSKLKAVMNELELSRSGLTRERPEEILGKLMMKVRIPFAKMMVARGWIKTGAASMYGAKPGDQVMRLERVEGFQIGVHQSQNADAKGSLWIDKIRFYNG